MKILRVIASMNPKSGGPCQGIRNTIQAMCRYNVVNEVVCLDSPQEKFLKNDPFKIYALGPANNPWSYSSKLDRWLDENLPNYDAVIVHGLWLYTSYATYKSVMRLERKLKSKITWYVMPHGMLDPYFQTAPDRKLKAWRNEIYWRFFEKKVVNTATALFFTSEEEMLLARKPFRSYKPKAEVNIGYGINPPPRETAEMKQLFYKKAGLDEDRNYFLFLSRIHSKKGVDNLITAYINIHENVSGEIPYLVIAGPGEDTPFGKEMKALASKNENLANKIVFTGMLSGDEKWGAFYNCVGFILPSHQENFGIAVVEAMACKKPVLISNQINIWREIKQSNGGIISSPTLEGTEMTFKEWFSLSEKEKIEMGNNAFEAYIKYFRVEKNIIDLLRYLQPSLNIDHNPVVTSA